MKLSDNLFITNLVMVTLNEAALNEESKLLCHEKLYKLSTRRRPHFLYCVQCILLTVSERHVVCDSLI